MIRRRDVTGLLSILAGSAIATESQAKRSKGTTKASTADTEIEDIIAQFERVRLARDPIDAGQKGDLAALALWPDDRPAALTSYRNSLASLQARLFAIPDTALNSNAALNKSLLLDRISLEIDSVHFDEARIPFTSGDGFYTTPNYAAAGIVLRSEAEADAWVAKLLALPDYYSVQMANMRRGIASGFMRPALIATNALRVLKAHAAQPVADHALLDPLKALPVTLPQSTRDALLQKGRLAVETGVRPAETRLIAFFETEYLPKAPASLAICDLPDGKAYYQYLILRNASTTLTPDAIHQVGLDEIARIRTEMNTIKETSGFKGGFREFLNFIATDAQFMAENAGDYYEKVSAIVIRAQGLLPGYFKQMPRLPLTIREVSPQLKSSSSGYYPGSLLQGVPGIVVINTDHVETKPLPGVTAWALHEGVPGHHLQIALAQENERLPAFRRKDDINAYVEGWALYCEHLGVEMGMYQTPFENFGRLSLEMWRACRLVIDTGMHALGLTRDQAVACLHDNTGLSDAEIQTEVDRYIGWPGQALGYKIGELKIRALRSLAETAMGATFDLRAFHDVILSEGAMPLDTMAARINQWINGAQI